MPHWEYTVDVSGVFHNDELSLTSKRDQIVATIRRNRWLKRSEYADELTGVLDELATVETVADFDELWSQVYDIADVDRAWIKTF